MQTQRQCTVLIAFVNLKSYSHEQTYYSPLPFPPFMELLEDLLVSLLLSLSLLLLLLPDEEDFLLSGLDLLLLQNAEILVVAFLLGLRWYDPVVEKESV